MDARQRIAEYLSSMGSFGGTWESYTSEADDILAIVMDTIGYERDLFKGALVDVTQAMEKLTLEGVDRGKGHWPAWDDCARAVNHARTVLARREA